MLLILNFYEVYLQNAGNLQKSWERAEYVYFIILKQGSTGLYESLIFLLICSCFRIFRPEFMVHLNICDENFCENGY